MNKIQYFLVFACVISILASCGTDSTKLVIGKHVVSVSITEQDGVDNNPYPMVLSHVFRQGDFTGPLVALIENEPIQTQTDIKVRWPDGSIKHAIISFLIPELDANETVTIALHASNKTNAYEKANLSVLRGSGSGAFDANFTFSGNADNLTLSSLLTSAQEDAGRIETWLAGSVVNEITVTNFPDTTKALSLRAHIRRFEGYPGVRVFHVVENTRAVDGGTDETYSLTITGSYGSSNNTILTETNITSKWDSRHGRISWIGEEPSNVHISYDIPYLLSTRVFPSYDPNLTIDPVAVASMINNWNSCTKGVGDSGLISKYFPNTGWRYEIGLLPQFTAMYLLTMDAELAEITKAHGIISGYAQIHVRETDAGKSARNRFISIDDWPYEWLGDSRKGQKDGVGYIDKHVERNWSSYDWIIDRAHQGSLAYVPYLMTGDRFYLEELYFWNAWNLANCWPHERGNEKGIIKDQVRGDAWTFRELGRVIGIAPESDTFERSYFSEKASNTLDFWIDRYITNTYHPLGVWEFISQRGLDGGRPSEYFDYSVRWISTPWQEFFLLQSLSHVNDLLGGTSGVLGNKVDRIRRYVGKSLVDLYNNLQERAFSYRLPVGVSTLEYPYAVTEIFGEQNWRLLDDWQDVENCYIKNISNAPPWETKNPRPEGWENPLEDYPIAWPKSKDFEDKAGVASCSAIDYPMVALGAYAYAVDITGGSAAYNAMKDLLSDEIPQYAGNPTFAIVPR